MGSLFLNIEAAQAGYVDKFKSYIQTQFPDHFLLYIVLIALSAVFLIYVLVTPVNIGNQKSIWLEYSPGSEKMGNYSHRKEQVKKIASLLEGPSGL